MFEGVKGKQWLVWLCVNTLLWCWYTVFSVHTCRSTVKSRVTVTENTTRHFNGHNCSVPSHGGPQSLTNSSTINLPIMPSQLWNSVHALLLYICTQPSTCVCLRLIDIYWQITPRNCSAARAKVRSDLSMSDLNTCCPRCSGFLF